ncbi:MAG: hypothetical protein ABIY70_17185 [Capsulimonas sp.]|uniref:hypothetical protein n=1 Tax=Capsulimonas sp. TaxID=2494211 RepID=UPI0032633A44
MFRVLYRNQCNFVFCAIILLSVCIHFLPPAAAAPARSEVSTFVSTVTDFRTSVSGRKKLITATVRFQNKTKTPLILGYVRGSASATDDQGNRYSPYDPTVRGIGLITPSSIDPKFILQPGESSDARFDLIWTPPAGVIYGTSYTFELTVREVASLGNKQYRLGTERALQFTDLKNGMVSAADAPAAPGASAGATPAGGTGNSAPNFYSAGPFNAEVTRFEVSNPKGARNHILTATVRFTNTSDQPLILGYTAKTGDIIDNLGNHYGWGNPGGPDRSATGIGTVASTSANADFSLAAGESRDAKFVLYRRIGGRDEIGTSYGYSLAVEELEILPSQQIRSKRQYSLSFNSLTSATKAR